MSTHAPLSPSNTARPWLRAAFGAALLLAFGGAQAFTVNITPQGEVGQVREIRARFDEDMSRLGDARVAQMPISISCDGGSAAGSAQWATQRDLVYRLDKELPVGARCTVRLAERLKSLKGSTAKGNIGPWQVRIPGPRMEQIRPYNDIEEEQHFAVRFSGAPTPQSVLEHVWCAMDGVGERIPVRIIEGEERTAALRGGWMLRAAEKDPGRYMVLTCQRRFTPGAKVRMVFGAGVAAANGTPSGKELTDTWDVRAPFTATMSCERENANAPCLPIRPVRLEFSSPLPLEDALKARLKTPAGE
ncbi:MAG: alpha-2-macroglobulin, partial [Ottowia sp.]|nr:alpha-2-macroglobulin [Ottowia sp.]